MTRPLVERSLQNAVVLRARRPHGAVVAVLCLVLAGTGCASWQKRRQLEAVARDWCYTIRASQILPVYPLTEDVQPGDLYLVQLPIDQQQRAYKRDGFLPLDNMLARFNPGGYEAFYKNSFGLGSDLPEIFIENDGQGWLKAPTAAFPSYAFSVKSGAGAKVAIPVSGVPVGLSLMNSDAADGSITISDVRTYGVDTVSLFDEARAWARKSKNKNFLAHFGPRKEGWWIFERSRHNYLRVVSRVYLTRKVNVSLTDTSSSSGQVDVGVPRTLELLTADADADPTKATSGSYAANVKALNSALGEALKTDGAVKGLTPGGTLKVVASSSRSISMVETFPRPLVLGYLGFDMEIDKDGGLGPPIPTYAVLHQNLSDSSGQFTSIERRRRRFLQDLEARDDPALYDAVATVLGPQARALYIVEKKNSTPAEGFRLMLVEWTSERKTREERTDRLDRVLEAVLGSSGGTN